MNIQTFVLGSVALLIQDYADNYKASDLSQTLAELSPELNFPIIKTYDFIVVGAGTAGCLVAARLSEKFNVLLLEAGGPPPPAVSNVYINNPVGTHPSINYHFYSLPQKNFSPASGGIQRIYVGKMYGGSGSHNGNLYSRGSPHDYDNFAQLTGDSSWSYENVLQHFKRFENIEGPLVNETERGTFYGNGPFNIVSDMTPILPAWFEAGKELGYNIGDPNGNQKEGFSPTTKSMRFGERESTYTAFIKPIQNSRGSLRVLPYSHVEEILFKSGRAYGVAYTRHRFPQIAHASKKR